MGGELVLSEPGKVLDDARICTIIPATPSLLGTLGDPRRYQKVRSVFLGGESPNPGLVQKWCSSVRRIFNCYGPTEATICASMAELRPGHPVVLGIPMTSTELLILNDQLEESSEGEICITGPGLASGYYRNEHLTGQRFISWHGRRLYRTLDRARRTPDGIVFCGREDSMVKNRGYLINIDMDVVPILLSYPGVLSAAAFMNQGKLVATVTPGHIDVMEMRRQLSQSHDRFVVPDQIAAYAELYRTSNGKLDRSKLQDSFTDQNSENRTIDGTCFAILQGAVAEALECPIGSVSMNRSFWELGGHSLLAIKLLSCLNQRGQFLRFQDLFEPISLSILSERLEPVPVPERVLNEAQTNGPQNDFEVTAPMTVTQTGMIRSSIQRSATSYMLVSIGFPWRSETGWNQQIRNAWKTVLGRHTVFRTSFDIIGGVQKINHEYNHTWEEYRVPDNERSVVIERESDRLFKSTQRDEDSNVFRPINAFLLIIDQSGATASLLWLVHHSLVDGWSIGNIVKEVQAVLRGEKLTQEPSQFWQFSQQLPQYLDQTREEERQFWQDALSEVADASPLSLSKSIGAAAGGGFGEAEVDIDLALSQIEQICTHNKVSSAAMIHAAWALLLRSYTSREQVVFGTIFSGRSFPLSGISEMVGPILNTCPFPINIVSLKTKAEFLAHVYNLVLRISSHQWSAAEALQEIMPGSRSRIFQAVLFLEYDFPAFHDCEWEFGRTDNPEFGLTILVRQEKDHLGFRALFDRAIYTQPVIQRMMVHFRNLFVALLDPTCETTAKVRTRMLEACEFLSLTTNSPTLMSPYTGPSNLKDSFEMGVDQWPDAVAVESLTKSITYRDFDQAGNYVASAIASRVRPGEAVGIVSDRSLDWLISVIAVIKAGAVYVALDTKLPVARMRVMIQTAKVKLGIFPNEDCHRRLHDIFHESISLHEILVEQDNRDKHRLGTITRPEDIAYITFTSGSTGVPKGVCIEHQSVVSYLCYGPARMDARPGRRHSQMFSPGFDVNVAEIFGSLCYGATLVLADPTDPFAHLSRVDATMITPSFLSVCDPNDFPNLDTILFAGEAVPQVLADRWAGSRTVYNSYGPCECTIGCLFQPLQPGREVTLGRTIPRVGVYILDSENHPAPIGVPGEICLSGIQISKGYIGPDKKELSLARFVPDPFVTGHRMYRTGDCAVWTEDMEPRFLGRFDNQVKVRGYRVELNEVENVIRMVSPEVRRAAAVVNGDSIVAFVEPQTLDIPVIQDALRSKLPEYACPSTIVALPSLPTMPNQKLDRQKLQLYSPPTAQKSQKSLTSLQHLLAEAWREAMGLTEAIEFKSESDFLVLGGSSLSQIKVAQIVCRRLNIKLPLKLFIFNSTLSGLSDEVAAYLVRQEKSFQKSPFKLSWKMTTPPYTAVSHLEEEFVKLSISSPSPQAYNVAFKVHMAGNVNITALEKAIAAVTSREPILQSCFKVINGQVIRCQSRKPCEFTHITQPGTDTGSFVNCPFDLSTGPLTRIVLDQSHHHVDILLIQHHSITDKAAIKTFFRKVQDGYLQNLGNRSQLIENATSPTSDYTIWAQWDSSQPPPSMEDPNTQYWKSKLTSLPSLPFQSSLGLRNYIGQFDTFSLQKSPHLTGSMELYVALVALAFAKVQGTTDIVIGIPHIDRTEPGTEDLLGVFLDRLPVRIKMSPGSLDGFSSLISSVRTSITEALAHSIPFKHIRNISGQDELFQVMVVYNRREDSIAKGFALPGITVEDVLLRTTGAKFPLLIELTEGEETTMCEMEYMENLVHPNTISAIRQAIKEAWPLTGFRLL
jgi:amino acid adenylation domain-containing protein